MCILSRILSLLYSKSPGRFHSSKILTVHRWLWEVVYSVRVCLLWKHLELDLQCSTVVPYHTTNVVRHRRRWTPVPKTERFQLAILSYSHRLDPVRLLYFDIHVYACMLQSFLLLSYLTFLQHLCIFMGCP